MDNYDKARELYIKNHSISLIAERLKVSIQTVYSWRKKDADTDKDWDRAKRRYNMSPSELSTIFMESVKDMVIMVSEDPLKLADPKYADAITKCIASVKKIDPMYNYMGAALDLIRVTNQYLKKADPRLAKEMKNHWPAIKEELESFASSEGLFR